MLRHKYIDRICCIVLAATLLLTCAFMGAAASGLIEDGGGMGYEHRIFDQSRVHTIDIVMDDWDSFLETCSNEEYSACTAVIDGEAFGSVAIRAKGNTSLSSVRSYGNDRYSFKIEFDHYETGKTYYGLDKLSLNNLIQDATHMKDYLAYTLMSRMGVAAPLCSFVQINVNGEPWGLYLAVEAVEDSFLTRNYGADHGELYKPDSMSMGGGRGNGRDFDMSAFEDMFSSESDSSPDSAGAQSSGEGRKGMNRSGSETTDDSQAQQSDTEESGRSGSFDFSQMPDMSGGNFDFSQMPDMSGGNFDFSQMPDMSGGNFDFSQMPDMSGGNFDFSQMPGGMGGFGGFGGMGSSDVMLQYSDDDPESYRNIFESAKTDVSEADQARLIEALRRLTEGETLEEKLSAVDAEAVIRYLVVHQFTDNGDSYTGSMIHNYYLYEEDGALAMIPWDYNLAFGAFGMGGGSGSSGATSSVNSPIDTPVTSGDISTRPILSWIFESEEYTALYHEIYQEFADMCYADGWLDSEIERVSSLIAPYVEKDEDAFFTYEQFTKAAETLREYCRLRGESIIGQLNGSIPSTQEEQRTNSAALIDASHINLSDMGSMGGSMGGGMGGERGGFTAPDMNGGQWPNRSSGTQQQTGEDAVITDNSDETAGQEETTGQPPESMTMPEGFDPAQMQGGMFGQPPESMTMPEGFDPAQMQGGMFGQPPESMTMPEGFDPAQMQGGMFGQLSEGMDPSQARGGNVPPDQAGQSIPQDTASQKPETAATEAPEASAQPSAPQATAQPDGNAANTRNFERPDQMNSGFAGAMPGVNSQTGSGSDWIMLAASAAVLLIGLLFVFFHKSGR